MHDNMKQTIRLKHMKTIVGGIRIAALFALVNSVALATAFADGLSARRETARSEIGPLFFGKQVSIQAQLSSFDGPEWWERNFGTKVFGCPAAPVTDQAQEMSLTFTTGGAGAWAGDLDGINTEIKKPTGAIGSGFAVPSNSTARLPEMRSGPELEFLFDGTADVKRSLVDAVAEKVDRCFSNLPPGTYLGDELSRLCPVPEVTRGQQKQTCVPYVSGVIGDKLADGSGYKVLITQQTMCDFVGYGRSGNTNTTFTPCFFQRYEGVATMADRRSSAEMRAVKIASKKALRDCGKNNRALGSRKIAQCVHKSMVKSMAASRNR